MPISSYPKADQKRYRSLTKKHGLKEGKRRFYMGINIRKKKRRLKRRKR